MWHPFLRLFAVWKFEGKKISLNPNNVLLCRSTIIAQLLNQHFKKIFCMQKKTHLLCKGLKSDVVPYLDGCENDFFDSLDNKKTRIWWNLIQTTFGGGPTRDVQWRHSYRWNLILMSSETQWQCSSWRTEALEFILDGTRMMFSATWKWSADRRWSLYENNSRRSDNGINCSLTR